MQQPEIKLYDLYDMWYEPLLVQRWFIITLIIVGFIFISLFIWFVVKKIRTKKPLLPWQRALQEFKKLEAKTMRMEHSQEFYVQLSHILKEYLQERYHEVLLDKTDQEVIEFFQNRDVLKLFTSDIEQVLQGAVRIKFAKQSAVQETMKRDVAVCAAVVQKTIPTKPSGT